MFQVALDLSRNRIDVCLIDPEGTTSSINAIGGRLDPSALRRRYVRLQDPGGPGARARRGAGLDAASATRQPGA